MRLPIYYTSSLDKKMYDRILYSYNEYKFLSNVSNKEGKIFKDCLHVLDKSHIFYEGIKEFVKLNYESLSKEIFSTNISNGIDSGVFYIDFPDFTEDELLYIKIKIDVDFNNKRYA